MAGEKIVEKSEAVTAGLKSDSSTKLINKDMGTVKSGKALDSISPVPPMVSTETGVNGGVDQGAVPEQGSYYSLASCCDYYYPGYNGNYNNGQSMASDNGFYLYYLPGYTPYTTGYIGSDGKQQPYTTSGYLQQPVSYGSDGMPCYSWCFTNGDLTYGTDSKSRNFKSMAGSNGSVKSNGFNSSKTNNALSNRNSSLPLNHKAQQFASSNFSKSSPQTQPLKQSNRFDSGFQPGCLLKFPSYTNQNQGFYNHYGSVNYQTNGRGWNGNYKFKPRENFNRNGAVEASTELTCGPRASGKCSSSSKPSSEDDQLRMSTLRNKYNKEDFSTEYDSAKFYVIKSYSEDDIHKSVKYDVWSSTPNGNKKLENAFGDAEGKASETGTECPVFLFFSVNGSGQFLGVAEMTGQVDFNQKKDFWQLDKWSGFFPVKWHIVKDVPNTQLRHIILENNDNKPVTYSRDTQEVGLKEGLEMLNIFKSYSEKSSLLDDFDFYEDRENLIKASRSFKTGSEAGAFQNRDPHKQFNEGEKENEEKSLETGITDSASSLIGLTENLSVNA
ncbi:PREDICTED: uncharacterized protein LOC109169480 isoform X1 [Ipomoea nil]|uniref:uncharacterized protein LOC109169480 isoform X1 n=1 Tax=Ipomoea nil TaxID=35883 RepID=UPI000901E36F|nr:PREDICTED: uncharacterized protein LOC109169480 isoform X1 [Ipomoea nil]